MNEAHNDEIEQIIGRTECKKNFKCTGPKDSCPCQLLDIGMQTYIQRLGEGPSCCQFSVAFANSHFCKCPMRVHIIKRAK